MPTVAGPAVIGTPSMAPTTLDERLTRLAVEVQVPVTAVSRIAPAEQRRTVHRGLCDRGAGVRIHGAARVERARGHQRSIVPATSAAVIVRFKTAPPRIEI